MASQDELLAAVLAQDDALWLPWRLAKPPITGWLYHFRQAYRSGGVRFRTDLLAGSDTAGRKAVERMLDEAEAAGLVATNRKTSYRTSVTLTDYGEARIRELLGMPTFAEVAAMFGELVEQARRRGGGWVPELDLTDADFDCDHETRKGAAVHVEETLVPLIRRALVLANANGQGNVFYQPACPWPDLPATEVPEEIASDAINNFYLEVLKGEQQRIAAITDNTTELGQIPLPTGWWPQWQDEPASLEGHKCALCSAAG
jgi:hypothetical protein